MFKINARHIAYLLLYSLLNSILSLGILYVINNALAGKEDFLKDYIGIVFLAMIVYTYLLNIIFQKWLNNFCFKILYKNEKWLFGKMLKVPLIKLEKLGSQRFFTTVEDLRLFAFLPPVVTHTVNSILMLILCLVYMFTLSISSGLIIVALIIMVAGCYFIVMNSMAKEVAVLRTYNDDYYKYVDDVMKGFKELKLNFFRRENLMNRFLIPNRDLAKELDFRINYVFLSINLISQYGLYFVIAVILFLLPAWGLLSQANVIAYVVIILFSSYPINNLVNLQQIYTRLIVANKRIKKFANDFIVDEETPNKQIEERDKNFESLQYQNISFSYENESEKNGFSLGPIDLEIKQGKTIFIVGGNGSGKSTFINVLTGLYVPTKGELILNGSKENAKEKIQNLIAAVFTDNHIFSHNYENYELENNPKYKKWITTMQLDHIVTDDTEESARRKFSKGQSKRMSLIFALLENKPILVLDEWAADQDPHFRKFFYEELIPKLKKEGKTIIAVTHDDAYFNHADRIIKFDYGQIVKDIKVENEKKVSEALWA